MKSKPKERRFVVQRDKGLDLDGVHFECFAEVVLGRLSIDAMKAIDSGFLQPIDPSDNLDNPIDVPAVEPTGEEE